MSGDLHWSLKYKHITEETELGAFTKMNKDPSTESEGEYWEFMDLICRTYDYEDPTVPGSMPKAFLVDGREYKLLKNFHGYTCDTHHCQKLFDQSDDGTKALLYTTLPVFSRDREHKLCAVCIHQRVNDQ